MSWMIISQIIVPILTLLNTVVLVWYVFFSGKKKDARQEGEDIGRIKQHCISTDKNIEEIKTDIRTLSGKFDDVHKSINEKFDSLRRESKVAHEKIGENIEAFRSETTQEIKACRSETTQEIKALRSEIKQEIGKSGDRLSKGIEDVKTLLLQFMNSKKDDSDKTN